MTDLNPLNSSVEDTGKPDSQSAKENESLQHSAGASSPNIIYACAAIAATLGIVAGIAFASLAGRVKSQSVPSNISAMDSNAVVLAASVKPQPLADANTSPADSSAAQAPADPQPIPPSHRKAKKRTPAAPGAFAIEGDDELIGFDTSRGVIQTTTSKFFLVSSISGGDISAKWQDGPSNFHYKCDLNATCTLTRKGSAVLYAKLKK
jgi:hypothetical protein